MMEKTVLEWCEDLPEPIRSKAIENYNPFYIADREGPENLHEAIDLGFWWRNTPEGNDYWEDVYSRAEAGEFNKPVNE